jgi:N-acyl-D-amino-acid deacylase
MSTGLFYAPGSYSDTAEITFLAQVLAERGRIYASHIRDEGNNTIGVEAALAEAISIIESSGVRGQISHLEAIGVPSWGKASRLLEMIDEAVDRGVDLAFDVNPYTTTGTHVDGALTPRWALEGGRERLRERFKDPETRSRIAADYRTTVYERRGGPERILITAYTADPTLEGKTLYEVARERRADPIDVLMEIAEREDATLVSYSVSEDDARMIMRHPLAMISSDSWAVAADGPLSAGRQHPCDFGTYPRVIETYWRKLEYWPIETAIAMCTSRPAAQLGLGDRGVVRPGARADLAVLDLDRVRDRSSLFDPHQYPLGIVHVYVSGEAVVEDEEYTGATPGHVLRPS